ncbi:MAG: ATP-binding protein [Snowella sp.]|nr:ATP-binding protein [Snowella sp.]
MNNQQLNLPLTFGDKFLEHHAGNIIADPHYALVELVANCWDAGADEVRIEWLKKGSNCISIEDNGTGMTYEEFTQRWTQLNYNRLKHQGTNVEFPPKSSKRKRTAFGRNGVGRHAMFCFASRYFVETTKNGEYNRIKVERSLMETPFRLTLEQTKNEDGHGTRIYTEATEEMFDFSASQVSELIGSRFVADPEFNIYVNNNLVSLEDIEHLCETSYLQTEYGELKIRRFDSKKKGRTSKQSGIAWWVNRRLVGIPSWEIYERPLLDARTSVGKQFTYVIEADQLLGDIKPDWSGFYQSSIVNSLSRQVSDFVENDLRLLLSDIRKERKREAMKVNRDNVKKLPLLSQKQIVQFVDEVQVLCPTMQQRDLDNTVQVLANLEKVRSGYALLEKLSRLAFNDLEQLEVILQEWSVTDAKKVLDELRYRLDLIKQLENLVEKHTSDELHDLQPLFAQGLWIFGPEFESISFTSNRSLATVVKKFFGEASLEHPNKRPDFVVLPDSSIGIYACDDFNENHEVIGFRSVVIVELKKGGFTITDEEKSQAQKYARELRRSGKINKSTKIVCYVLGTYVNSFDEDTFSEGETVIHPRTYNTILRRAHARTFNLLRKIESIQEPDCDLDETLQELQNNEQVNLFEDDINPFNDFHNTQNLSSI